MRGWKILGVGMGTSFYDTLGSILGVNEGYEGRIMVGLRGGETYVTSLGREVLMWYIKLTVEVWGGLTGAATIM